jgi:hypothetical protein
MAKSELILLKELPSSHAKFLRNIMKLICTHLSLPHTTLSYSLAVCNFIKRVTAGLYTVDFLLLLMAQDQPGFFKFAWKTTSIVL